MKTVMRAGNSDDADNTSGTKGWLGGCVGWWIDETAENGVRAKANSRERERESVRLPGDKMAGMAPTPLRIKLLGVRELKAGSRFCGAGAFQSRRGGGQPRP